MSSRRSRSRQRQYSSGMSEDQIAGLVTRLHELIPELRRTRARNSNKGTSANQVLEETCNYIRVLQREVDDLSDRLSQLLPSTDTAQDALIRSLIHP